MKLKGLLAGTAVGVALAVAPAAEAATGLMGHWRFDEGAGTLAKDSSGHAIDGAVLGSAQWVSGHRGPGALAFDGGHVDVAASSTLAPQAVTASAWVKRLGSPGQFKYILAKGASGCIASSFALYSGPGGGLQFYVSDGFSFTRSPDAGAGIWDGNWHHVAGTYDGNAVRLYVDAIEVGSGTPRTDPIGYGLLTSDELLIGTYGGCAGLDLAAAVDEPRVWDRALGAAEIEASTRYEFKGFFSPVDNPEALNVVKAGSSVPVKFSLTGFQGMDVIPAGGSASQPVSCDSSSPLDVLEETAGPGTSGLTYDSVSDRYHYVWKTDKAWAGTCRQLTLRLDDGSTHVALFKLTR
jgi:hypothetical protein